jgi:acyl carrier protein
MNDSYSEPTSADPAVATALDFSSIPSLLVELKRMLVGKLAGMIDEGSIEPATPLLEGGLGIDSMTLFEFVDQIEKRFGFLFPEQSLTSDVFKTLNSIAAEVSRLRQGLEKHD